MVEEAVAFYQNNGVGNDRRLRRAVHDLFIARLRVIGRDADDVEEERREGEKW